MKQAGYTKGNVIALTGTASQNNVTDRMAAFKAYMKKYPQYKIVAIQDANWDQATSAKDAQQLLSKYASQGGIQGAYGMADNMAVGIIQGAKQAGVAVGVAKKGLIVTGSNCLSVGIKAIQVGQEYGTGTQAPQVEAALAVKVATQILTAGTRRPRCRTSTSTASPRRTSPSSRSSAPSKPKILEPHERRTGSGRPGRIPSSFRRPARRRGPPRGRGPLEVVRPGAGDSGTEPRRARRGSPRDLRAQRRRQEHAGSRPRRTRPARRRDDALRGEELSLRNPQDAQARGIALVNQELSLVPELSVEDNIFLGGIDVPLLYRRRRLSERARRTLDGLGLAHVPLHAAVESLAIGERQLVEIARLLVRDARLLILDEPTATLSKPEIERVFRATRELVAQGRSVIFVSHRLDEVFDLCDRVTVLRDGRLVGTHTIGEIDRRSLIELMLGEMEGAAAARGPRARRTPRPWASMPSRSPGSHGARKGRGLLADDSERRHHGSRRTGGVGNERGPARARRSRARRLRRVEVQGRAAQLNTPRRASDAGIVYIPNDRQREGLFLGPDGRASI